MLDRNEESSKPDKPESPPQLKKSRTISGDDATPIFPGPLFPAVRRISTIPSSHNWPPPDRHASTTAADHRDFSDRDWVFPSFVLPQNPSKRSSKKHASDASTASQLAEATEAAAERKKIKLVPQPGREAPSTSELTRPSSRTRARDLKPSLLLLFLVSPFPIFFSFISWLIWTS